MNDQAPGPPSSMLFQMSFVLLAKFLLVKRPPSWTSSPDSHNIELGGPGVTSALSVWMLLWFTCEISSVTSRKIDAICQNITQETKLTLFASTAKTNSPATQQPKQKSTNKDTNRKQKRELMRNTLSWSSFFRKVLELIRFELFSYVQFDVNIEYAMFFGAYSLPNTLFWEGLGTSTDFSGPTPFSAMLLTARNKN